jgi:predicted homoserine dehydrogenase-like protein
LLESPTEVREKRSLPIRSRTAFPACGSLRSPTARSSAVDVYKYSGRKDVVVADAQNKLDDAIRANQPVATEDALFLSRLGLIEVIRDVTGAVEFGAHVVLEAL